MRPIAGQNPEAVLGQTLTNEQKIMWQQIFNIVGYNCNITPLNIIGAFGNLSVYNANILYVAYSIEISGSTVLKSVLGNIIVYNQLNAISMYYSNSMPAWDTTAAAMRYAVNSFTVKNIYFGRIVLDNVNNFLNFNGYQITY